MITDGATTTTKTMEMRSKDLLVVVIVTSMSVLSTMAANFCSGAAANTASLSNMSDMHQAVADVLKVTVGNVGFAVIALTHLAPLPKLSQVLASGMVTELHVKGSKFVSFLGVVLCEQA